LDVGGCLLEPEGRECVDVRGVCVVCWDVRGVCLLEGGKCVGVRGVWVVCWDVRGVCLLEKGECVIAMQSKLGCHPHLARRAIG
jgi:hypothetical protein